MESAVAHGLRIGGIADARRRDRSGCVRGLAIDSHRRREPGRLPAPLGHQRLHSTHRHNSVVSRTVIAAQELAIDVHDELGDALRGLPWRQQAALVLRYHLDLTEADIATALDCRPSTVRSIIKRGLDTLRKEVVS
ncbi:unnamed protein product [Phaeothamnion confervicola]